MTSPSISPSISIQSSAHHSTQPQNPVSCCSSPCHPREPTVWTKQASMRHYLLISPSIVSLPLPTSLFPIHMVHTFLFFILAHFLTLSWQSSSELVVNMCANNLPRNTFPLTQGNTLTHTNIRTCVRVSPLLPIPNPNSFNRHDVIWSLHCYRQCKVVPLHTLPKVPRYP